MKKIAIIGVEEGVGREVLNLLSESNHPVAEIVALEPRSAIGNTVSYGEDDDLDVVSLDGFDFKDIGVAVFAATAEITKRYAPKAVAAGAKVISCSDAYAGDTEIPMILAGFNTDKAIAAPKSIVSVPSAAVVQMLAPLQTLAKEFALKRIVVSTYTSVANYGREAMDELFNQTRHIFMNNTLQDEQKIFHKQIAFNVIPQLGDFIGEETAAEWEFNTQVKQILGWDVKVHANCAVVSAFVGMAQFVNAEFCKEIDVDEARELIKKVKGVVVFDKQVDGGYVTLHDVQGENGIYVSRLRQDASVENGISFWVAADHLRAAGAQNIVRIIHSFQPIKLN